jgi:hypothetical protein
MLVIAAVAACGAATDSASPSATSRGRGPTPTPSGPLLSGTVQTSEDVSLSAQFRAPIEVPTASGSATAIPGMSCATYAAGSNAMFAPPQFDITSGGHSFYIQAIASGYHGAGDYSSPGSGPLSGTIAVGANVGSGQQPAYSIFRSAIGGSSTLSVRPDGSGTFTFSEWGSDEVRGNTGSAAAISGALTWTCG